MFNYQNQIIDIFASSPKFIAGTDSLCDKKVAHRASLLL